MHRPLFPFVLSAATGLAQQVPPPPQEPVPAAKSAAAAAPSPSPFAPDAELRAALGGNQAAAETFQPLNDRPVLPEMHLRGIVRLAHKSQPAALIEVRGFGSYTARQGDSIAFTLPSQRLAVPVAQRNAADAPTVAPVVEGPVRSADELRKTSDQRAAGSEQAAATSSTAANVRASAGVGVLVSTQIPIVLRVVRVDRDGVVVEIGTLGQLLVIR